MKCQQNLRNYHSFEALSIDFEKHLTVMVAENGVSKTAIVDAIAVALARRNFATANRHHPQSYGRLPIGESPYGLAWKCGGSRVE